MSKHIEMKGLRFGRLTVLSRAKNSTNGTAQWNCICDCGNETIADGWKLRSGQKRSCGCLWKEKIIEGSIRNNKKQNDFRIEGNIVFVKLANSDKTMKVDLDTWNEWAKEYRWRIDKEGYAYTRTRREGIVIYHRRAFPDCPTDKMRDHIDGDRLNNTRQNIRFVTPSQNMFNRGISKNNTSGYSGVYFHKETGKWAAEIKEHGRKIYLGIFETKEEAMEARKQAEEKYHGEYRRNK